ISSATEQPHTSASHLLGDSHRLLWRLDCARTSAQSHRLAADQNVARRRRDRDDGIFFFGVAADQLVGLANGDAFHHPGHRFERADVHGAGVAGDADSRAGRAGNWVRLEAQCFDSRADGADLLFGSVGLHDDQHRLLQARPPASLSFRTQPHAAGGTPSAGRAMAYETKLEPEALECTPSAGTAANCGKPSGPLPNDPTLPCEALGTS